MFSKRITYFLISFLLVFAILTVGCTQAPAPSNEAKPSTPAPTTSTVDIAKEQARVKAATLIGEEKLTFIFVDYTPEGSNQAYLVAKDNYKTIDDIKAYLADYYTAKMIDEITTKYIKLTEVPGKGNVPVLTLPADYVAYAGEEAEINVNGEQATLSFSTDSGKVTYALVKQNEKWLVDGKTITK